MESENTTIGKFTSEHLEQLENWEHGQRKIIADALEIIEQETPEELMEFWYTMEKIQMPECLPKPVNWDKYPNLRKLSYLVPLQEYIEVRLNYIHKVAHHLYTGK